MTLCVLMTMSVTRRVLTDSAESLGVRRLPIRPELACAYLSIIGIKNDKAGTSSKMLGYRHSIFARNRNFHDLSLSSRTQPLAVRQANKILCVERYLLSLVSRRRKDCHSSIALCDDVAATEEMRKLLLSSGLLRPTTRPSPQAGPHAIPPLGTHVPRH